MSNNKKYLMQKIKDYGFTIILLFLSSCAFTQALTEDNLDCPDTPNCVSSYSDDERHSIKPFTFNDVPEEAMKRLKAALLNEKRVSIIEEKPTYLRAEVRSLIFRFVDDVEFILVPEKGLVQLRSSARIGYSDFGVNRRRMERIRALFQK
jgi:uncharacterized protein (DUF1499 family)